MMITEILKEGAGWAIIILSIIQIAPIKINPWTALGKAIARAINGETLEKIGKIDEEVHAIRDDVSEQAAISARARIVRFGDEVMKGQRHSKDHFDQTLKDIKAYERYCNTHPDFENNVTELVSERIKEVYKERLAKNDFL